MSGFDDIETTLMEQEEGHSKKNTQKSTLTTPPTTSNFKTTLFQQENYYLTIKQTGKTYKYTLLKGAKIIDEHSINKKPEECNKDTKFISRFIKQVEGTVKTPDKGLSYTREQISTVFMQQLRELQAQLDDYTEHKDEIQQKEKEARDNERLQELEANYNKLNRVLEENNVTVIDFIKVCITYLINGENKNTLLALLCHLSTYFKRGPLWFMAVGKSGEGKSTIEKASIDLLPSDAYMNGNMSEAALYRKSLNEGKNFLDGKIMRFGDLGGETDFKKNEDILNVYKQLSTEGIVELELTSDTVDEETGERNTTKFTVEGYCSVSFATVHTEDIDEQYQNRGRLIEPEATNDHVRKFKVFNKGKYANHVQEVIDEYINSLLHDYIEYIHLTCMDVQVFNPYLTCLHDWLNEDEFFKRSVGQYEKLVEAVTILESHNRERICNSDGDEFIVSTCDDNDLVTQLFIPSFGLSPVAIRLFNKMDDWFFKEPFFGKDGVKDGAVKCDTVEDYIKSVNKELTNYQDGGYTTNDFVSIFTVAEIKHRISKTPSLKGIDVGGIVNNLVQHGYIVATDVKVKRSNKNIYRLNFFEKIHNRRIEFDDACISSYLENVVPETYGDIEYVCPDLSVEMKNIENDDKLRECSIGKLEVAKWF